MWYVKCASCGEKIWEGKSVLLSNANEGIGRKPFCDVRCLASYMDALTMTLYRTANTSDEFIWKEDKRRKRLPERLPE